MGGSPAVRAVPAKDVMMTTEVQNYTVVRLIVEYIISKKHEILNPKWRQSLTTPLMRYYASVTRYLSHF